MNYDMMEVDKVLDALPEGKLISFETVLKLEKSILFHPHPYDLVKHLQKRLYQRDLLTIFITCPYWSSVVSEEKDIEIKYIHFVSHLRNIPSLVWLLEKPEYDEEIPKLTNEFFPIQSITLQLLFIEANPKLVSWATDLHIANSALKAFLDNNQKAVDFFMERRMDLMKAGPQSMI